MLPERLSVALALFAAIVLLSLGLIHEWPLDVTLVAVLAGVLVATIFGRLAGRISSKELAKSVEDRQDAKAADKKTR